MPGKGKIRDDGLILRNSYLDSNVLSSSFFADSKSIRRAIAYDSNPERFKALLLEALEALYRYIQPVFSPQAPRRILRRSLSSLTLTAASIEI